MDLSSVLGGVFEGLESPDARRAGDIFAVWRKILLGIKSTVNPNEGANLAAHSRIVDIKNGVLLVEADHPGWIELLQLRKNYILKGLAMYAKDVPVQTLAFRVAGKRGNVTGSSYSIEEARGLAESRLDREEAALAKAMPRAPAESKAASRPQEEMAPELSQALAALGRDMGVPL